MPNGPEEDQLEAIRKAFPRTWYHPQPRLLTWFPSGLLNEAFAHQIVQFVELEERVQNAPFDRYADFSGLTAIRLEFPQLIRIARRRQHSIQPVKSAFYATEPMSAAIARTYARQMEEAMIDVRAFEEKEAAAAWLEVPVHFLEPPG
jgi:hypothetical protein